MGAIGIGLVGIGYTLGLWGWCLVTGRNVSLRQLVSVSTWPPGSVSAKGTGPVAKTKNAATGTTQAPGTSTAGGRG